MTDNPLPPYCWGAKVCVNEQLGQEGESPDHGWDGTCSTHPPQVTRPGSHPPSHSVLPDRGVSGGWGGGCPIHQGQVTSCPSQTTGTRGPGWPDPRTERQLPPGNSTPIAHTHTRALTFTHTHTDPYPTLTRPLMLLPPQAPARLLTLHMLPRALSFPRAQNAVALPLTEATGGATPAQEEAG